MPAAQWSIGVSTEPGQMQFVHNRAVGHARTAFVDFPEPGARRQLVRLWLRDAIDEISDLLRSVQRRLLDQAEKHAATLMPGFTHLQVAQPVTFGHHLLGWIAIAGAVIVLARRSVTDTTTSLIAIVTLLLLLKWKLPEPLLIVVAGAIGVVFAR